MELSEEQDDPTPNHSKPEPKVEKDPRKGPAATPRKPFDTPLPDIKPLPGEPKNWWNPGS